MSDLRGQTSEVSNASTSVAPDAGSWLSAIVESSFDAIVSKTLDSVITSWNDGAERLFGHSRADAVGQHIALIIPEDRLHEETEIIARLRQGERIERFETSRLHKDGGLIDVEITVSPVRDAAGHIVGASKIARGIGERKRQQEEKDLVIREMHHRVQNIFAIMQGLVALSRRHSSDAQVLANEITDRLISLSAAHELILAPHGAMPKRASLESVLRAVLAPYLGDDRIRIGKGDLPVGRRTLTTIALILHELATNAVKYGGLSGEAGGLEIDFDVGPERVELIWRETGGQAPDPNKQGFGTDLMRATLRSVDGKLERTWQAPELLYRISFSRQALKG